MSSSSSSTNDAIRAQKQALRKEIRARMKQLSANDIATQSQQVWQRLFALPEYQQAKSIGLFLSMPEHEINTDAALADAIRNNKTIYVPEVGKNFELADMELIQVILSNENDEMFHKQWPRNKWDIPEPCPSMQRVPAKVGDIDLLVVPGLAFDAKGGRLGHGKGYYDRFLARMRPNGKETPKLVAVGLEPQFMSNAEIPVTELDYTMDIILLPNQTVTVSKDS
jgi:5-formyltetrahydrofolate cyclo-ligase